MAKIMLHDEAAREALGRGDGQARRNPDRLARRRQHCQRDRARMPVREYGCSDRPRGGGADQRGCRRRHDHGHGLADALVQDGLKCLDAGANPVELVAGLEAAVAHVIEALKKSARPLQGNAGRQAIATIAANDAALGQLVAEAFDRAGPQGIVDVQYGIGVKTTLDVLEGMSFDRGYLSHHMVTDVERMQAVLENPYILMTDQKIASPDQLAAVYKLTEKSGRPLLILAEDVSPSCIMDMLSRREKAKQTVAAVYPPEFGHWRKAMLEDIAIATGGKVIARDLGGKLEDCVLTDLGSARQVRISAGATNIIAGGGNPDRIEARREQIKRQYEAAPENVERDKFTERLAKLSGGTAVILCGGATPVEQKRKIQIIEDAIHATRAAIEEGVVPGGGVALVRAAPTLEGLIGEMDGSARQGAELVQRALKRPLHKIATNSGLNGDSVVDKISKAKNGSGLDARSGKEVDLIRAGVIDPVKVCYTALQNAASVASLILTTQTLVAKKPDNFDPTAGPALGGGAERLGLD